MVSSKAHTVDEYLHELPPDKREVVETMRELILNNLPTGYEECMQYGMISYIVPKSIYPETYNNQPLAYLSLAAQKNHFALYLSCLYAHTPSDEWFSQAYQAAGKKLNMGKSCVRFKRLEELPLEVIAKAVGLKTPAEFIKIYESARANSSGRATQKSV